MNFSIPASVELLQRTPATLHALLHGLSAEWVQTNEGEGTWSAYDVIGHLVHLDRCSWIQRIEHLLQFPDVPFPAVDREAQFRNSEGQSLQQLLAAFAGIRTENLEKLAALKLTPAQLQQTGTHPQFGRVTLAQLVATWAVHDLDHLSQVTRVLAKQYSVAVGPWTAFLKITRSA